jgi:hypothetical protein
MLDDALKLTVDKVFPPKFGPLPLNTEKVLKLPEENLWDLLVTIAS